MTLTNVLDLKIGDNTKIMGKVTDMRVQDTCATVQFNYGRWQQYLLTDSLNVIAK